MEAIDHAHLQKMLTDAAVEVEASHLHGFVTGLVCGGANDHHATLDALALDRAGSWVNAQIKILHDDCLAHLSHLDMGLQLSLPSDQAPLQERTEALIDWVRGYLSGLGLSGARLDQLSDSSEEAIQDLGTIGMGAASPEETEEDENALVDIIEFVRVAVMMLAAELRQDETSQDT